MNYLLYAVLVIVVYAEVLPTISLMFEYIRTWLGYGINTVQQKAVAKQEAIQEPQERLQPQHSNAIGFEYQEKPIYEEEDEDYE